MTQLPFFSIIIPTRDRPQQLGVCLASLTRLDYPLDLFEVIVVDDGSISDLRPTVQSFAGKLDIKFIQQPNGGPGAARNTGARTARGRFLAFTDDDCQPSPDWLRAFARRFAERPADMLGGRTLNALAMNAYAMTSQMIQEVVYGHYNANPDDSRFFASNNLAVAAEGYNRIGGFSPNWMSAAAEDRDLCDRWQHAGLKMSFVADAVIHHAHDLTLRKLWRQHFNYGRGACYFRRAQHARGTVTFLPELSFYLRWLTHPFAVADKRLAWRLSALMLVAHAANAIGFFAEACSTRRPPAPS